MTLSDNLVREAGPRIAINVFVFRSVVLRAKIFQERAKDAADLCVNVEDCSLLCKWKMDENAQMRGQTRMMGKGDGWNSVS